MTTPTPRERLTRAGLSAQFADLVLNQHAHQLAETIRNRDYDPGAVEPVHLTVQADADLIDPKAQR
jgi:hypothetical protein